LGALGLLAVAVRCGPAAEKCGELICTSEQRCTASKTCVTDTPPTLKVESPTDSMHVNATSVTVTGTAFDDVETGLVVDVSTNRTVWFPAKIASDGSYTATLTLPPTDASTVMVTARAKDGKGHVVMLTRSILVDNQPPACAILEPVTGLAVNSSGSLTVKMSASDGSQGLMNLQVSTDGAATFKTPTLEAGGDYSYVWALSTENGVTHDLVFRVDDINGHSCEARASVLVDNVPPTIAFSTPLSASLLGVPYFTAGGLMGGTAQDQMRALKSVTLDFADGAGPRMATLSTTGNHAWSVNLPQPANDDYKPHLATAVVTDLGGNTATATLNVIVDIKPPLLTLTGPQANAKLNISNFPASNNVPLVWQLSDGDPTLAIGLVQPDGGLVSPPVLATSPADNPKAYTATLRANDRAGNTSTQSVSFTVDRVAPTVVTRTPVNDTRMYVGAASADFSEPMMGGDGLGFTPFQAGVWTTTSHYQVSNLLKDKVYQVTTGPTTDLHGNPVVVSNWRFHTETWQPTSGATLAPGYKLVLAATTDQDGTVNLVGARTTNSTLDWMQLDPVTGNVTYLDNNVAIAVIENLVAARTVQADLSSRRLAGYTVTTGGMSVVKYNINGAAAVTAPGNNEAFIPTPPLPAEGTGLAEFGLIGGGQYKRTGRTSLPLTITSVESMLFADNRWQAVAYIGGGTWSQDFSCSPTCGLSAPKTLGGASTGTPNSAISQICAIHGYLNNSAEKTTMFRFQPGCGGPTNACAPDLTEDNNFDQVVADPNADGTFYGYNTDGAGNYQLKKRVLSSATCGGSIVDVGAPVFLGALLAPPRLIVIRGVPGLIYSLNNDLHYVTP
jgi:hypothetical protein